MHHKWPRGCKKKKTRCAAEQCIHMALRGRGNTEKMETLFYPFESFCFYNHYTTHRALRCIALKHLCHIRGIFDTLCFLSSYSPCNAKSLTPAHFQSSTCLSKSCSSQDEAPAVNQTHFAFLEVIPLDFNTKHVRVLKQTTSCIFFSIQSGTKFEFGIQLLSFIRFKINFKDHKIILF